MFRKVCFIASCVLALCSAYAGVTATSRMSIAVAHNNGPMRPPYNFEYTTTDLIGQWVVYFPDNSSHADNANNSGLIGWYDAMSYSFTQLGLIQEAYATSVMEFDVTINPVRFNVTMSGQAYPMSAQTNPELNNAYVGLYDQSGKVIFDSFNYATFVREDMHLFEWNNVVKDVIIAPGHYRLVMGAKCTQLNPDGEALSKGLGTIRGEARFKTLCICDLNGDGIVDDADFLTFCISYDIFSCSDPSMPQRCTSDFNYDVVVDDADFQIFLKAYDDLLCE